MRGDAVAFKGKVLSVGALIERSAADVAPAPRSTVGVRHTAAGNARNAARMLVEGAGLYEGWRHGILQTVDDYASTVRRGGVELGAVVFAEEPAPTGSLELDAAFAAVAEHLAERDGWTTPAWALNPGRVTVTAWYPGVPSIFRAEAERESPRAFRRRGILITSSSLARA